MLYRTQTRIYKCIPIFRMLIYVLKYRRTLRRLCITIHDNFLYVSIMLNATNMNNEIQILRSTSNQQAWATRGLMLF